MTRALVALATLACGVLLTGCPESVQPLSDPSRASPDPALLGVWHGTFDGDEMYLHAGPGERGMIRAIQVEHKKKGGIETARYAAFPTRLGKLGMLNVRSLDESADYRGYLLFRYEIKGRRLTLWMLSLKAAREDIKAGRLAGKAEGGEFGDTLITASSPELAAYVEKGDPKRLFGPPLVFRRIAQP